MVFRRTESKGKCVTTDDILVEQPHRVGELLNNALEEAEELFSNNTKRGKKKKAKKDSHIETHWNNKGRRVYQNRKSKIYNLYMNYDLIFSFIHMCIQTCFVVYSYMYVLMLFQ